jgi:tetratricopeptide (TPR) repeat protein
MFFLGACDGLFDVDNPTNILDQDLADPQLLRALSNTPQGAVSIGYAGGIQHGEIVGDAATHVSTNTAWLELDAGVFSSFNEAYEGVYNTMAQGRWVADDATRRLEELVANPSTDARVGVAYFWSGVARTALASLFEEIPFDNNPPQTPAEIYRDAIEHFQKSAQISAAAGDAMTTAAALGQVARSYRDLYFEGVHYGGGASPQLFAQAENFAREALSVRPDYLVNVNYAPPGSTNTVFTAYSTGSIYNVMDAGYANRMDPVSGQRDMRIRHNPRLTVSSDGRDVYEQQKYDNRSSPIPVSRWQESELIIAEHRFMQGDYEAAVNHINRVRSAAQLSNFVSSEAAEIWEQLMYERETEFFLEMRRWQDMRYYEIMPPRWIPAAQALGVHRRWPVSVLERGSNPYYR